MTAKAMNKDLASTTKATGALASKLPPPMKSAPMSATGGKLASYKQLRYLNHIDQRASHANPELATIGKKLVTKASTTAPKAIAPMAMAPRAMAPMVSKVASLYGLDADVVRVLLGR